jgi:hypothetical protein
MEKVKATLRFLGVLLLAFIILGSCVTFLHEDSKRFNFKAKCLRDGYRVVEISDREVYCFDGKTRIRSYHY